VTTAGQDLAIGHHQVAFISSLARSVDRRLLDVMGIRMSPGLGRYGDSGGTANAFAM